MSLPAKRSRSFVTLLANHESRALPFLGSMCRTRARCRSSVLGQSRRSAWIAKRSKILRRWGGRRSGVFAPGARVADERRGGEPGVEILRSMDAQRGGGEGDRRWPSGALGELRRSFRKFSPMRRSNRSGVRAVVADLDRCTPRCRGGLRRGRPICRAPTARLANLERHAFG